MRHYPPAMSKRPDVTVSIVSGGSPQLLADCLDTLPRAAPGLSLDVAVVDNAIGGPLDGLAAAHADVRWIRSDQRRGFAANHNLAVAGSNARYLFVLNDDTVLGPSCIERLAAFLGRNPAVGCVGPRLVYGDGRRQASAFHFPTPARLALTALTLERAGWVMSDRDRPRRVDWVHGAAMFLRADAFRAAGGFDERFYMYLEDVDLCRRLADLGWKSAFLPDAWLTHLENASTSDVPERRIYQHARSRILYARKHHGPAGAAAVRALTAGMYTGRIGASRALGRDPAERARFAAHVRAAIRPGGREAVEDAAGEYNRGRTRV
jgi:N-acetylglucosaminyl-diphospho-decaprenol L-rhamnosyltransferase